MHVSFVIIIVFITLVDFVNIANSMITLYPVGFDTDAYYMYFHYVNYTYIEVKITVGLSYWMLPVGTESLTTCTADYHVLVGSATRTAITIPAVINNDWLLKIESNHLICKDATTTWELCLGYRVFFHGRLTVDNTMIFNIPSTFGVGLCGAGSTSTITARHVQSMCVCDVCNDRQLLQLF